MEAGNESGLREDEQSTKMTLGGLQFSMSEGSVAGGRGAA